MQYSTDYVLPDKTAVIANSKSSGANTSTQYSGYFHQPVILGASERHRYPVLKRLGAIILSAYRIKPCSLVCIESRFATQHSLLREMQSRQAATFRLYEPCMALVLPGNHVLPLRLLAVLTLLYDGL